MADFVFLWKLINENEVLLIGCVFIFVAFTTLRIARLLDPRCSFYIVYEALPSSGHSHLIIR